MSSSTLSARKRFIVVGRAGMDLYPEPAGTKIADATQFSAQLGGSAANIAAGLSRLGADVALLTALSDDPVGRFCLKQLAVHGIDSSLVQASGAETRSSLALSESRIEDHETLIYRNGAADFDLDASSIQALDLAGITAVVITGTALAREPSRTAVFLLIEKAREAGIDVVLDVDYRPYSWASVEEASSICSEAARSSTILVGNEEEFAVLAGDTDLSAEHGRNLAKAGVEVCIYKMGGEGAISFQGGREIRTGVFPVEALKPVGAGDAFMASFLSSHYDGEPLTDCVTQGSAAAALVVTRKGCSDAMPTADELREFMSGRTMVIADAEAV